MNPEICIVDDEPGIANMCKDYLQSEFNIRVFTSPKEALREFDNDYRPDVLLTDIKMPEMDGFAMARQIHEKSPDLPVVMMSGYADKRHVLEAMSNDASGFIEKPFDPRQMKSLLAEVVKKTRHAHALQELVDTYAELGNTLLTLNTRYVERYTLAENRLQEEGISLTRSPEQAKALLTSIQLENELNRKIDRLTSRVDQIKQNL